MTKKDDMATVLAFEKKLVPSDGYLYGTSWEDRNNAMAPLRLRKKSVRGTISNRLKKAVKDDPAKLNAEVEKPNLQTIDACSLTTDQDTLKLNFTLKVLGGIETPSACNNANFQRTYRSAALGYIAEQNFEDLARRYAVNIANARFLWRNRVGAEKIEVVVNAIGNGQPRQWKFDALKFSTRDFSTDDPEVEDLAQRIASSLSNQSEFLLLDIEAYAQVGKAQDVYPSEELVFDKGKGEKSKVLYEIDGIAALHSQKIGNALRTIDTWYPEYDDPESSTGPIAAEPYGAVTSLGKAFRNPTEKTDFYTLFDRFARGETLAPEEQHYVMAVLVRGGVFGESGREGSA